MISWDPARYLGFAAQRQRPFADLVGRIPVGEPRLVVDLGCGPGTATAQLLERWPSARVIGVDSSPDMLEMAGRLADPPRLAFARGDVGSWEPDEAPDVIVANAVFQWVPSHLDLLGRFAGWLAPGGVLAFQVPANFDQPIHALLRDLASSDAWAGELAGVLRADPVADPGGYLSRLLELGMHADVWETTYMHLLEGPDAVFEWASGTALRPVLSSLGAQEGDAFALAYRKALAGAYPARSDGRTVLPFRRVFAVASTD